MDHETLSLYPKMDSFPLFPISEHEHISSDYGIAQTQHLDSSGGSTRMDYSNDSPQSIASETKIAPDLSIIEASTCVDVPKRPQPTCNPSTSSCSSSSSSLRIISEYSPTPNAGSPDQTAYSNTASPPVRPLTSHSFCSNSAPYVNDPPPDYCHSAPDL
jgi:hypothetical protein